MQQCRNNLLVMVEFCYLTQMMSIMCPLPSEVFVQEFSAIVQDRSVAWVIHQVIKDFAPNYSIFLSSAEDLRILTIIEEWNCHIRGLSS